MKEKICYKCHELKSIDEYCHDSSKDDDRADICKDCKKIHYKSKSKTIPGLIKKMYYSQHSSSRNRGLPIPDYTYNDFFEWIIFNPKFKELYYNWVESDYKKDMIPSCDRLNDYIGYKFGNIQLLTWKENNEKGRNDIKNDINLKRSRQIIVYKYGDFYGEYPSIKTTSKKLGICRSDIQKVLSGKFKQSHNFVFFYKENINNNKINNIKHSDGVIGINCDTGEQIYFNTIKDAQIKLNISNISEVCSGKRKQCGGFRWEYYNKKMEEINHQI